MKKKLVFISAFSFPSVLAVPFVYAQEEGEVALQLVEKVSNFYGWALGIGAIAALGVIIYGGIRYMTSAGNPTGIGEAKKWIYSAFLGLALLFGAFLILNTINPNLTRLEQIMLLVNPTVEPESVANLLGDGIGSDICLPPGNLSVSPSIQQICPFEVKPTFSDTWCAYRRDTQYHLGTDMSPPSGAVSQQTKLVAIESGTIINENCGAAREDVEDKFSEGGIAGRKIHLQGDSGNKYFYGHIDRCADGIREGVRVSAGQHIAYVGRTGNASETPFHLHLGIKTGGISGVYSSGTPVNPYNMMNALCRNLSTTSSCDPKPGPGCLSECMSCYEFPDSSVCNAICNREPEQAPEEPQLTPYERCMAVPYNTHSECRWLLD